MSLFKPAKVNNKSSLGSLNNAEGQFIIVKDAAELYLDENNTRKKISQNVYIQKTAPSRAIAGDVYIALDTGSNFSLRDVIFTISTEDGAYGIISFYAPGRMDWKTYIDEQINYHQGQFSYDEDGVYYNGYPVYVGEVTEEQLTDTRTEEIYKGFENGEAIYVTEEITVPIYGENGEPEVIETVTYNMKVLPTDMLFTNALYMGRILE